MSATRKPTRNGSDNYPTEGWAIRRLLEAWPRLHEVGNRWLEPCAGDGVIMHTVNGYREDIEWTAIEQRDARESLERYTSNVTIGDFFEAEVEESDVVIMNPPFNRLMEFVLKALDLAPVVITFQSLNFLGSGARNEWLLENTPDLYVLPDRTSHTGDGKTDSVYSAWYVWDSESLDSSYKVLQCTPIAERREDRERVLEARNDVDSVLDRMFDGNA